MLQIHLENKQIFNLPDSTSIALIKETFSKLTGIHQDVYLLQNGKLLHNDATPTTNCNIHIVPKLIGGKGGFGSMLRAIGAQIEKTTNREACRDLSGRRLRDINEEKRLKNWIAQQVEREKEAADRRKKKLEKQCERPRHEFRDAKYDKERSDLPDKVEDAVLQGLKVADTKRVGEKRKKPDQNPVGKKKPKLWIDADVDDLSSSGSEGSESDVEPVKGHNLEIGESSKSSASCSSSTSVDVTRNDTS